MPDFPHRDSRATARLLRRLPEESQGRRARARRPAPEGSARRSPDRCRGFGSSRPAGSPRDLSRPARRCRRSGERKRMPHGLAAVQEDVVMRSMRAHLPDPAGDLLGDVGGVLARRVVRRHDGEVAPADDEATDGGPLGAVAVAGAPEDRDDPTTADPPQEGQHLLEGRPRVREVHDDEEAPRVGDHLEAPGHAGDQDGHVASMVRSAFRVAASSRSVRSSPATFSRTMSRTCGHGGPTRAPDRRNLPDLSQAEAQLPRLRDEPQQREHVVSVDPVARLCPPGRREDAHRLVEPERLPADPAPGRDLAGSQSVASHVPKRKPGPGGPSPTEAPTGGRGQSRLGGSAGEH